LNQIFCYQNVSIQINFCTYGNGLRLASWKQVHCILW